MGSKRVKKRVSQLSESLDKCLRSRLVGLGDRDEITIPHNCGVYIVYESGKPVWVGSATDLRTRIGVLLLGSGDGHVLTRNLRERRFGGDPQATKRFLTEKCGIRYVLTGDRLEAALRAKFFAAVLETPYNEWQKTQQ